MFKVDEERRKRFEQGLEDGLSTREAAEAAGYSPGYARQLAFTGPPSAEGLVEFGWAQIHDKKNSDRVRQRYWERLGEYLGLWGSGRKPPPSGEEATKPEPFVVKRAPRKGGGAEE